LPATLTQPDARIGAGSAVRSRDPGDPDVAVPKKKKSKMKSRSHRAGAWKLSAPARSVCPTCGSAKTPHTVCPTCGRYKNRVVIEVG
jgi:large subunit ribosomal protein L32